MYSYLAENELSFPRGRIGATATALLFGFRLSNHRKFQLRFGIQSWAPGLRIEKPGARMAELPVCGTAGSPLARWAGLLSSRFRAIPVERNSGLWECNVTPVYCTCQEGNTICCVASNDGLGAGLRSFFPQIPRWWSVWKCWIASSAGAGMPERNTTTGAEAQGSCVGDAALKRRSSTVLASVRLRRRCRPSGTRAIVPLDPAPPCRAFICRRFRGWKSMELVSLPSLKCLAAFPEI
jgi:hypothetical protein